MLVLFGLMLFILNRRKPNRLFINDERNVGDMPQIIISTVDKGIKEKSTYRLILRYII